MVWLNFSKVIPNIFVTRKTWKLILNVTHHVYDKEIFWLDCLKDLKQHFFNLFILFKNITFAPYTRRLLQKRIILKICVKNIWKYIMWDSAYIQKRIKTPQIIFLVLSTAKWFTLRSMLYIKYSTLRKQFLLPLNVLHHC